MAPREVAPGIHRLVDSFTNLYLVDGGDRALTLVDAGVPGTWRVILAALRELGRRPDDIAAVVLTHAHFDHLGAAERARRELGIDVWVHEHDARLTREPRSYGREVSPLSYAFTKPRALPMVASFLAHRAWWPEPVAQVRTYATGTLDVPGSPHVVRTPGHTHGHCALHFPDRDTLIAGDAVVTLNPYTGRRGPQIVARAANADTAQALDSLYALGATGAGTVLVGHGEPFLEGAEAAVELALAAGAS